MNRSLRLLVVAAAFAVLITTSALPAAACSVAAPPVLEEVLDTRTVYERPVTGVFEVEHIARVPGFGIRDARSVSVVTRYWGERPPTTGRIQHGSFWLGSSDTCGNGDVSTGTVLYSWTDGSVENRGQFSAIDVPPWGEPVTADQQAALAAAFGDPIDLPVSPATRAAAWAQILWFPALLVVALGVAGAAAVRRIARSGQ